MKRSLIMLFLITLVSMSFGASPVIGQIQPQPEPPGHIIDQLNELKDVIREFAGEHNVFTDTNTAQQANALCNKIDAVIGMVLSGNYLAADKKLENDISPKLNICVTTRDRARSWLSNDPELQDVVEVLEGICQEMINEILIALNRLVNG